MKARIIDKKELRKSPSERQAESLLRSLTQDKVIEVDLKGTSSRTIRRAFTKAGANLGLSLQMRTKDEKVYVLLKEEKGKLK